MPTTLSDRELIIFEQTTYTAESLYTLNQLSATTTVTFVFSSLPVTAFKTGEIVGLVNTTLTIMN